MGKKKSKKRSRHASSSEEEQSTSGSEEEKKNDRTGKKSYYEEELEKFKEEHKRKKMQMKANETPEEKARRRRLKKERKELKRGLKGNEATDTGDNTQSEGFLWKKKEEVEGRTHYSYEEKKRHEEEREEEVLVELEKVKKRKIERELKKQAREEEAGLLQREKEAAMFSSWEKQEDDFHLHQARLRSSIRIRDGRAKAIDLLAGYINPDEEELEIQMHEPYTALVGLSIDDLEDLLEDIKVYVTIDKSENLIFWEDITTIVKDELEKLKKRKNDESASTRDVINPAVHKDVHQIFHGKTYAQLTLLQTQMKDRMKSGGSIDVGYWESLLQQCEAYLAKARLKESHQKFLKKKLREMKMESHIEEPVLQKEIAESSTSVPGIEEPGPSHSEKEKEQGEEEDIDEKVEIQKLTDAELKEQCIKEFHEHAYSPKLLQFTEVEQEKWIDPEDDIRKLSYLREQVRSGSTVEEELEADNMFNTQVLNEDEEAFNNTVALTSKKYLWSDKYRPRKPRFFNRVHTGYEWNKYNQTHYDQDNPPPKVVQGYKFNIFYPDLIEQTVTPEYIVTPCEDDKNFAVLRFKAGPPYEDIAFKIVNREWECAGRRGFKCQFNNKIFQLYFHFKRYRYRR